MSITAQPQFNPEIKWANGPGCLHCASNFSDLGAKAGVQCVDLGVDDQFLGRMGLCYDCAIQVAIAIDYRSVAETEQVLLEARETQHEAAALLAQAQAESAQARLDKDTIERLVGSVYQAEPVAS